MPSNIKINTYYEVEIFFETVGDLNEENVERALYSNMHSGNPDLTDYVFSPGSPASSPYFTVRGPSRSKVLNLAKKIVRVLNQLGVQITS